MSEVTDTAWEGDDQYTHADEVEDEDCVTYEELQSSSSSYLREDNGKA